MYAQHSVKYTALSLPLRLVLQTGHTAMLYLGLPVIAMLRPAILLPALCFAMGYSPCSWHW
jgi:hypothetical protein